VLTRSESSPQTAGQSDGQTIPIARKHLAALDGIRFIAAFCVLLGHGYWYVVLGQTISGPLGPLSLLMLSLPGPGMTLFFVLSGFVIHLNYHRTVSADWSGTFDFFIARFSRLYPLFLVVFVIDFYHLLDLQGYFRGRPQLDFDLFGPLPFFLSFTQTWLFIPFNGYPIYDHYSALTGNVQATGAMWSLSTEWLFYAAYPLLSGWLSRQKGRRLAVIATIVAMAGVIYCVWGAYNTARIQSYGAAHFGTQFADAFQTWILFYSPAERMLEFLLGAIAAQQYLALSRPTGPTAQWPGTSTTVVATVLVAWLLVTGVVRISLSAVNASLAASLVAGLVLLVVRHPTWLSRCLSWPILVKCGEASYSLYLLHWYTMHQWVAPYAVQRDKLGRQAVFITGVLLSIAVARVVYLWFERPALKWLRINFRPLKLHIALGLTFLVITFFSIVASMHVQTVIKSRASISPAAATLH
jgi:peptidoglycan/LPS O-acetylase OafA/YrhL